jgi:hypothetical protein
VMAGCNIVQLQIELANAQAELAQALNERRNCVNDPDPPECFKLLAGTITTLQQQISDLQEQLNQCTLIMGSWISGVDFPDGGQGSLLSIRSWDSTNLVLDLIVRPFGPRLGTFGPPQPVVQATYVPSAPAPHDQISISMGTPPGPVTGFYSGRVTSQFPTPTIVGTFTPEDSSIGPVPWNASKGIIHAPPGLLFPFAE